MRKFFFYWNDPRFFWKAFFALALLQKCRKLPWAQLFILNSNLFKIKFPPFCSSRRENRTKLNFWASLTGLKFERTMRKNFSDWSNSSLLLFTKM